MTKVFLHLILFPYFERMKRFSGLIVVLFLVAFFRVAAQSNLELFAVSYTEAPDQKVFMDFGEVQPILLPLGLAEITSPIYSADGSLYFVTRQKEEEQSTLWHYDFLNSTIKPLLSLDMEITAMVATQNSLECILRKLNKTTYLLKKYNNSTDLYSKSLLNRITASLHISEGQRLTVDGASQLALTDSTYEKFQLLSNKCGRKIHKINAENVAFIYKFSEKVWYLKQYDLADKKSHIVVKMPQGVDDYVVTKTGNFLCHYTEGLFAYHPEFDVSWRKITLPIDRPPSTLQWIKFISDDTVIMAFDRK